MKAEGKTKNKVKEKMSKSEMEFKHKFYELMFELDLYNKFKKTYLLNIIKKTNYGYYVHLYLVPGLSFDGLINKKSIIEQSLKCLWIMNIENFQAYAEIQIVLNPIDESKEYQNPKIKASELYLGLSFSNQMQKNNNNDNCMTLLAGATGTGKTRFIYQVLLSWILSCSPSQVQIYLSDIAKNEYIQFSNVKHVKYYASELEDLGVMMTVVLKEYNRRKALISKYREKGMATNISEYNKIGKISKLPYCYIVIDEFSILLPDKTDSKDEKNTKEIILDALKRVSKLGRSLGMFTFVATQKTTRDELPSILKNMSAVRISFRANDLISSEVIMGNNSAVGLPTRVAAYSLNGGTSINYLYAPKLTVEMLKNMLKPYIKIKNKVEKDINKNKSSNVISETTFTRIPKGVNIREYLDSIKNKEDSVKNEEVYNDY